MKKTTRVLETALVASLFSLSPLTVTAVEKMHSLRWTDVNSTEMESEAFRREKDRAPIPRDFVQQPPLIPHTVQNYHITVNFNNCMDCHAWTRYKDCLL